MSYQHAPARGSRRIQKSVIALAMLHCSPLLAVQPASEDSITVNAQADTPDTTDYSATQSSTASKSETPLSETPQSVSVVTQSMIQDYDVTSLNDAMKFVSGVAQGNTLGGTEDGFVKRGFGANSDGSILIDGVRSNQGLALIPPSITSRCSRVPLPCFTVFKIPAA